jgi:hypothetical protein
VFVGLVTVVGVTAWLLTGAVGLAKDPGMVRGETEFMTGTGDGIVVGVVRSGMVLSVGSGYNGGLANPMPGLVNGTVTMPGFTAREKPWTDIKLRAELPLGGGGRDDDDAAEVSVLVRHKNFTDRRTSRRDALSCMTSPCTQTASRRCKACCFAVSNTL